MTRSVCCPLAYFFSSAKINSSKTRNLLDNDDEVSHLGKSILDKQNWKSDGDFIKEIKNFSRLSMEQFIQTFIDNINLNELTDVSVIDHALSRRPPNIEKDPISIENDVDPSALNFISNFIDIIIRSFTYFNGNQPPVGLYDIQAQIQIYCRIFQIPLTLALLLQPVLLVAWKVYLVTMMTLGTAMGGIFIYLKYLKPFPKMFPHCENIEKLVSQLYPHGIDIGLDREMNEFLGYLNSSPNSQEKPPIMLEGISGNGKTALICKLALMIKNKEISLPDNVKDCQIIYCNAEAIMADTGFYFGDKINNIEYAIKGLKNVIFVIDEIQAITSHENYFVRIKKFMRTPGIQFVGITTIKEHKEKIQQMDVGDAFQRPFNYIHFSKWEDRQIEGLLRKIVCKEAEDISFDDEAFQSIIEITNKNHNDHGQPSEAIKLLRGVMGKCRTNFGTYQPKNLKKMKDQLTVIRLKNDKAYPLEDSNDIKTEEDLTIEIEKLEKGQKKQLEKAALIQALIRHKIVLKNQLIKDHHALLQAAQINQPVKDALQKRYAYLFKFCIPAIETVVKTEVNDLKGVMDLKVDKDFVEKIFYENLISHLSKPESEILKKVVEGSKEYSKTDQYGKFLNQEWNIYEKDLKTGLLSDYNLFEDAVACQLCKESSY